MAEMTVPRLDRARRVAGIASFAPGRLAPLMESRSTAR